MKRTWLLLLLALGCRMHAEEEHPRTRAWQKFESCTFVATEYGDGDSFRVLLPGGEEQVFRLTWVDCPEIDTRFPTRILEQARHFGIATNDVPRLGKDIKAATEALLAKPFTLHTRWASAMGMSRKTRYYAFITLADNTDLGQDLLRRGWARVKGVSMNHPDGTKATPYRQTLESLESSARDSRSGLWARPPVIRESAGPTLNRKAQVRWISGAAGTPTAGQNDTGSDPALPPAGAKHQSSTGG